MHSRRTLCALLALLAVTTQGMAAGAQRVPQVSATQRAMVVRWQSVVNHHQLPATTGLFAASGTLRIAKRTYTGQRAIKGWWQGEFKHSVHIAFLSPVQLLGKDVAVLFRRKTRSGDCPKGCMEQARVRFSGSHFSSMSLQPVRLTPPSPAPIKTGVPPLPTKGPPPVATPTIPT